MGQVGQTAAKVVVSVLAGGCEVVVSSTGCGLAEIPMKNGIPYVNT